MSTSQIKSLSNRDLINLLLNQPKLRLSKLARFELFKRLEERDVMEILAS